MIEESIFIINFLEKITCKPEEVTLEVLFNIILFSN